MSKPLSIKINPCKKGCKESKKSRLAVLEAFESGKIGVNKCDLGKIATFDFVRKTDIEGEAQQSSSDNVIALGRLKDLPLYFKECISLKIGFEQVKPKIDNSFQVEEEVYRFTNKLVKYDYTPHVVVMYAAYICKNFLKDITTKLDEQDQQSFIQDIIDEMNRIDDWEKIYNLKNAKILMLERSQGTVLKNWKGKTVDDQRQVLFQILYTLHVFNQYNLRHNDLHEGNVFVEELPTPVNLCYVVGKSKYFMKTKWFVKIYDFDLATIVGVTINTRIEDYYCKQYGICNEKNTKYDLGIILYDMLPKNRHIHDYVKRHISDKLEYNGRLVTKGVGNYCPSDDLMSTPTKMLRDRFFNKLKTPIKCDQIFMDKDANPANLS